MYFDWTYVTHYQMIKYQILIITEAFKPANVKRNNIPLNMKLLKNVISNDIFCNHFETFRIWKNEDMVHFNVKNLPKNFKNVFNFQ